MRLALYALCAVWLLFAPTARAERTATLIVLVADDPNDTVANLLERDLRALGFGVMLLGTTPENSLDGSALERTARSLGGMAAVRILPEARGTRLWVLDPATDRSVSRELLPPTADVDPNEVALGTLELLRASILELRPPAANATAPTQPATAQLAETAIAHVEAPATFSVMGGVGLELGLRSLGPSLNSVWALWLRLGGCFGARGFTAVPLSTERRELVEGAVEVRPTLLGLGLTCSGSSRGGVFSPRVSLGAALAHLETVGLAVGGRNSHRTASWLGGGYALLGMGLRLSRDVQLNLDATGVVLPTPAVVIVDQREVATWGAPGGLLSLGLEVATGN